LFVCVLQCHTIEAARIRYEAECVTKVVLYKVPAAPHRRDDDHSSFLTLELFNATDFDLASYAFEGSAYLENLSVVWCDYANVMVGCNR
jgi:hypothetical protein